MSQDNAPNVSGLSSMLSAGLHKPLVKVNARLDPLRQAVLRIEDRWPDMAAPDERDRDEIVRELAERHSLNNWRACPLSLVCAGIRAAFDGKRLTRHDLDELRSFYFREIEVTYHSSLLNAALATYLESFEPEAIHTRQLATALNSGRPRFASRSHALLSHFPNLFDPRRIVDDTVNVMLEAQAPYQRLVQMGIRAPHGPGLMDHAHLRFVGKISSKLGDSHVCDRFLDWLGPKGKLPRRIGSAEAIDAIVGHWTERDPPADRQSVLTRRLVEMYGDPRRLSGDPWNRISKTSRDAFLRWLTGENLRILFEAITDTNESHMWDERKKFYLGLHDRKRIDDAWVAFAPAGERQARKILERAGHSGGLEFGRQIAGGTRSNTSLLIAKIGSKIVVDGSHSYKVHIFRDNDPRAPKLFLPHYDCERIRFDSLESKIHHSGWQNWVLMRI